MSWQSNALVVARTQDLETGEAITGYLVDVYRTNKPIFMTGNGTWYFGDQRADNGEVHGCFYGGLRMVHAVPHSSQLTD